MTQEEVEDCSRFYRDHCLHGIAGPEEPSADQQSSCIRLIEEAGERAMATSGLGGEGARDEEACEIMATFGVKAKPLAGGTDLLVNMKKKILAPEHLVSLSKITAMHGIEEKDDQIIIGFERNPIAPLNSDYFWQWRWDAFLFLSAERKTSRSNNHRGSACIVKVSQVGHGRRRRGRQRWRIVA